MTFLCEVAYPDGYATSKRLDVGFDAGIELWWDEAGQPSTAPYVGAELELSSAGTRLLAWGTLSSSRCDVQMRMTSRKRRRRRSHREGGTNDQLARETLSLGARARRSFAAIFTRSARESAFIFRITWPRWAFTVISLMPSSPPICLFNRPDTTNAMTSRSRWVRDA